MPELAFAIISVLLAIFVFGGLIYLLFRLRKARKTPTQIICKSCGSTANGKKTAQGSLGIEILLWLLFFPIGILYTCWRVSSTNRVCPICSSKEILPIDSPLGKKIAREVEAGTWSNG